MSRRTLSPAPLLEALPGSDEFVATMLGVSMRTVVRWRLQGKPLALDMADKYAIRAGSHPLLLWPEHFGAGSEWDE